MFADGHRVLWVMNCWRGMAQPCERGKNHQTVYFKCSNYISKKPLQKAHVQHSHVLLYGEFDAGLTDAFRHWAAADAIMSGPVSVTGFHFLSDPSNSGDFLAYLLAFVLLFTVFWLPGLCSSPDDPSPNSFAQHPSGWTRDTCLAGNTFSEEKGSKQVTASIVPDW